MIPLRAQVVAILLAVLLLLLTLDLVRRKKLKEEYSVFWILLSALLVIFASWSDLLIGVTRLVGAYSANSIVFFFGFVFLVLVLLHISVVLSGSAEASKDMAQKIALLDAEIEELKRNRSDLTS